MAPEIFGYLGMASHLFGQGFLAYKKFRIGWILMTSGAIWWFVRGISSSSPDLIITNLVFAGLNVWYTIKNWGQQ